MDKQTQSLHYYHGYAVFDRIDLSEVSDLAPERPPSIECDRFLPTSAAITDIQENLVIYVQR